jgi:hypothetical protein
MKTSQSRETRRDAWAETKKAVRAYSRNPTERNATQVRTACTYLRAACGPHTAAPRASQAGKPGLVRN